MMRSSFPDAAARSSPRLYDEHRNRPDYRIHEPGLHRRACGILEARERALRSRDIGAALTFNHARTGEAARGSRITNAVCRILAASVRLFHVLLCGVSQR